MKVTIYLDGIDGTPEQAREIRSRQSHILLALVTPDGISLYDRKSRMQHCLNWADIDELRKQSSSHDLKSRPMNASLDVVISHG